MTEQSTGRIIGGIVLVQLLVGILINAVLTTPLFGEPGYLAVASKHGVQLGVSVLLSLLGAGMTLVIPALAFPILKRRSLPLAIVFLSISIVAAALSAVEQVGILAMRDFSDAYQSGDAARRALLESLRVTGAALRNGAHYVSLLVSGATLATWYFCLLRFALIPRALAAFGLLAVAMQLYSISQPILGGVVSFPLLAPLALAQLLQAGWLLGFGFKPGGAASTRETGRP